MNNAPDVQTEPQEAGSLYVAWLDLGEGEGEGWVRAFETRDPAEAFFRLAQEQHKAGARRARLLPAGLDPADEPEPGLRPPWPIPAGSVWEAGQDGGAPTISTSRAVGWLFTDGVWERVCENDDVMKCAEQTQRLGLERGVFRWQVLPEGREPKENDR